MKSRCRNLPVSLFLFLIAHPSALFSQEPLLEGLSAPSVMLIDIASSHILLERGADILMPPASLAKLMTLHLSLSDVMERRYAEEDVFIVPFETSSAAMGAGSSLMGLAPGDRVSVLDLQRGAAVVSGNDAAHSLALLASGDLRSFVDRMNREAAALGMSATHYVDPDGWSEKAVTRARDQAAMAMHYLRTHPYALEKLHALPGVPSPDGTKMLPNTNLLLGEVEGVDGLKTGSIPEAGFHFLATARREETRLLVVLMGIEHDGLERRAREASVLLERGFDTWQTLHLEVPVLPELPLRRGRAKIVRVVPERRPRPQSLKRSSQTSLTVLVDLPVLLKAPLKAGEAVGRVSWWHSGLLLDEVPLLVPEDFPRREFWGGK